MNYTTGQRFTAKIQGNQYDELILKVCQPNGWDLINKAGNVVACIADGSDEVLKSMGIILTILPETTTEIMLMKEEITQRNEYYENKIDALNRINDINHAEITRLQEALEGLPKHKCRHCNGDGYTSEHANHDHFNGDCSGECPIQVQCEDCHGEGYYVTLDTIKQALNK